jgi:hypothetical protein
MQQVLNFVIGDLIPVVGLEAELMSIPTNDFTDFVINK